jgi:hypothetical protein
MAEKDDDRDDVPLGPPTPGLSVYESFDPTPDMWANGADGLPVPLEEDRGDGPYPFKPENLVCIRQDDGTPACSFYKRQLVPLGEHHDQRWVDRWCTHPCMRGLNGASLNLSESAMFACELREPPHLASIRLLDEGDAKRIEAASGPKKFWPMFQTPEQSAAGVTTLGENDYETKRTSL